MPDGQPVSYDGLLNNRFNMVFDKLPNVSFFLQGFSLPSVMVDEVKIPTPIVDYNEIGEKMEFSPFTLNFLVDSQLRNWKEVFAWMKRMTVNGSNVGESGTATIFFNGEPVINFIGAWPTVLGGIDLDTTTEEAEYVYGSVTINYDYFDVIDSNVENYK